VCRKQAERLGYCKLHAEAYQSIIENYSVWKKALGVSWKEYLSEVIKNSLTGEWAKEVAEHLAKEGDKNNVKIY
jgi:hypothetical protein